MDQRQFFLRDILTVVFKHKTLLMFFPILVFLVVFVGNYVWPPTYESEAEVRLIRGREVSQTDTTVTQGNQNNMVMVSLTVEDVNSTIQLLQSDDLLRAVAKRMKFDEDVAFAYYGWVLYGPYKAYLTVVGGVLSALGLVGHSDDALVGAVDTFRERVDTEHVRDSHVLSVSVRMGTPDRAQETLEVMLEEFQKKHIEVFQNTKSVPFFEEQKARLDKQVKEAQTALEQFRTQNDITLLDMEESILLNQYTDAQRVLLQLSEIGAAVGGENIDSAVISSLSGQTDSTVVREMQLRLLELLLEQNRVTQSLGPQHPEVLSIRKQVQLAKDNLVEAIANTKALTETKIAKLKERINALNGIKSQYDNMNRDAGLLTSQLTYYTTKLEESRVADALAAQSISSVRIISQPTAPVDPVRPKRLLNLVVAIAGGIVAALALAFFLDYLDHGLKTPEDVEFFTKLAPLASFWKAAGRKLDPREAERLAIMLEANREAGKSQIFEVTSAVAGEGAPLVAYALAEAFARDPEARTLLIDFTGDTPGSKGVKGLSDVLVGDAPIDSVFPGGDALTVVGRGSQADTYLWGSKSMDNLTRELRARYQYIVFSVGPTLQSHDAIKLARQVDGILMTIKADSTRREVVARAVESLKEGKSKVLGAVLTERTQSIPQVVYRRI